MLDRCPHTLPDAHPVTTRAAGLDRAVRRQLDTGKHAARGVAPNTLSNNAGLCSPMSATVRDLPEHDHGGRW